jgi:transposase InsO family protein
VRLPRGWADHVKSAFVHAVSLAHASLVVARGWCLDSPIVRVRLRAQLDAARAEEALLKEELRILRARLERIPPAKRPHFPPSERLAILLLRAARGWTAAETARRFLVTPVTISQWMRRLNEQGVEALLRVPVPVNRVPEYVQLVTEKLRALLPRMGKVRIAHVLARAGLRLSPSTVARLAKRKPATPPPSPEPCTDSARRLKSGIVARRPHHTWHVDATLVPIVSGFWAAWLPFALPQCWPFCWWVVGVLDRFSRGIVAARVYRTQPSAEDVCSLLGHAVRRAGRRPKYIITDQGAQFRKRYRAWCKRRGIRPRFGAVGQVGSIAIIERFWRSMKDEAFRVMRVPGGLVAMRTELAAYVSWYNTHRPHQALHGATPLEMLEGRTPAVARSGIAWRPDVGQPRAPPELVVKRLRGRAHLPIVELRDAA